ncbi:MAG: hypothetical protein IPO07_26400 [Haliscomenobacter sp.]|nr:hypothetical protein [Haliscomenobacter sp.]MBK9491934.1 hypothetical protein [Haliscomenobacter sp.]
MLVLTMSLLPGNGCVLRGYGQDLDLKLVGATYLWQDGSTSTSINATQAGKYKVIVELSGCTATDSTTVRIISPAAINLGRIPPSAMGNP